MIQQQKSGEPKPTRRKILAGLAAAPLVLSGCGSMLNADASTKPSGTAADSKANAPDAIVIGTGSIGCNTAWHLQQRGLKVLVLESRPQPTMQSTPAAAGFIASWSVIHAGAWQKTEWLLQRYGIDFYTKLAKRTTADVGYSPCGIAYIYSDPKAWQHFQPRIASARKLGTTVEVLKGNRQKEVTPFLDYAQLGGVAFDPDAIRIRAGAAIRELARELAQSGVEFRYNTAVTDFIREGDRVVGVRSNNGDIKCDKVIVAAGAWGRPLIEKVGYTAPSKPYNQTRYVTKPLPGLKDNMPLLIFADLHYFYIRAEMGGLLIGGSDPGELPADRHIDPENPPPTCDHLPQEQAYRIRGYIRDAVKIMPMLEHAEIDKISSGIPQRVDDSHFIAGPVPGVKGLFMMSGCLEAGITHGPGLGKILSEYAIDGKTEWDASKFRPDRFTT